MSLTCWFLVSNGGTRHRLPREMIFVGRDDCELMLQSRSVDKQHAVINYDAATDEHLVKDLGSLNGTFINDVRIPEQIYIALKLEDKLRFGYDTNLFTVVRREMKVPEEALKHEKFTSQLQFAQKQFETEESKCKNDTSTNIPVEAHCKALEVVKTEDKLAELSALPRGTPLYGQPSWWGDEDAAGSANKQECCYKDVKKSAQQITITKEEKGTGVVGEPSYFEIPSKELQKKPEMKNYTNEMTAQDSHCGSVSGAGHASFTIEFDEASPGKVTIRDHITKFTDHRQKAKKPLSSEDHYIPGLNTEMIAAESKVADWLVQNNPPRLLKEAAEKDTKSIKSDVPVYLKKLRGSKHEDGTQSDYENSATLKHINTCSSLQNIASYRHIEQGGLDQKIHTGGNQQECASQTAFLIEFFDDDHPRKRRSYSFSINNSTVGLEAPYPIPESRIEKVKMFSFDPKGICVDRQPGLSSHRVVHCTQNAKLLHKPKSEEPFSSLLLSQNVLLRSSGSFGHRPEDMRVKPENIESSSVEINKRNSHIHENANSKDNTGDSSMMDITTSCRKHWASQWASLASNHVEHEQDLGLNATKTSSSKNDADLSESGTSHTSEIGQSDKKRHLPKLPNKGKSTHVSPSKCSSRSDIGEKQDTELQEKGLYINLSNKNGLYGSNVLAMGKQIKPTDSRIAEKTGDLKDSCLVNEVFKKDGVRCCKKPAVYKIQHEPAKEHLTSIKMSYKPPVIPSSVSASSSPNAQKLPKYAKISKTGHTTEVVSTNNVKKIESDTKETVKPLVRQGSFTIDKPSSNVPIELIPHINKQHLLSPTLPFAAVNIRARSDSLDTDSSLDTTLLLKDTEAVMAFLEAKLQDDCKIDDPKTPSYTQENSLSPESDVDSASTISFIANDTDKKSTQKRKTISGLHKDIFSMPPAAKEFLSSSATINKERIERKGKTHAREAGGRTDIQKVFLTSERNRLPSIDLTDDDQTSSLPCSAVSDILSSDQETYSGKTFSSADDKFTALKTAAPNKTITLPRPRPTRTSLLRRSRLGEASDTDVADTDKASVASDVSTTSSTSKQHTSKKALSRIDLLAQPRRARLGSLSARSDSEAIITRCSGSSRNSEYTLRSGVKITPKTDGRSSPRARANSISRLSEGKEKTVPPAYSSAVANSRWKRIPHEYASTSEDEFGSNRNSPKPSRLRTASTFKIQRSQITGGSSMKIPSGALSLSASKHKAKEQDDYIHDWTAHREEIARISQDLALIAREINDVAGEIDSVTSSGTAPSTTVSTAATTPGSAIDTREELVDRVFDESLNFRKIPSSIPSVSEIHFRAGDFKPRSKEGSEPQVITRRKACCRDEVMGDSLLLSSVFQFSQKIRQTIDKTTNKIRILFKDKERNWDEIERKFISEGEIPILKTSCVEIVSILQELKKIEKQLQVINAMIDPDGTLDALNMLGLGTSIPSSQLKAKQSSSVHSDNMSLTTVSQMESRTGWLNMTSVSSNVDGIESSADFNIQCNRFNPDGKEDSTSQQ